MLHFVQHDNSLKLSFFLFVIKLKVIVKLVLEIFYLVDVLVLDGDVIVLPHGTQLVLQLVHVLGAVYEAVLAEFCGDVLLVELVPQDVFQDRDA